MVHGDERGRLLGFPTANVELGEGGDELPADGVYEGWLKAADGVRRLAAVSVGSRPTYYGEHGVRLVEAYLLDFEDDLYGQSVQVGINTKIRDQVEFSSTYELVLQMRHDVQTVRDLAGSAS